MKKLFLSAMLLLTGFSTSMAQTNSMTVENITLPQNSEATLTVNFQFDAADTYTGYQFNLELPSDIEFTKVEAEGTDIACTLGSCHHASHTVTANLDEGLVKVAGLSLSSAPISGTSGVLLTFTIKPVGTLTVGQNFTGHIKDIQIAPIAGGYKDLDASEFTVTIGEPVELRTILDETSTVAPVAADGVDVRVKRTIKAGNWSSICLPFAMTEAQVKAAFGEDVEIKDFNGIESTYDGDNCTAINVKFVSTTAIEANHPYIIKVSSNITEFTADNVNIAPEEIPAVDKDKTRIGSKYYYNSFIGTYVANTEVPEMALFLSGSNFAYSKGKTKMKAFRGYFSFLDLLVDYDNASARIMMVFDEGTTGINENMRMKRESDADGYYYNLSGQRVENPGKGLYIKNNKKVIIK